MSGLEPNSRGWGGWGGVIKITLSSHYITGLEWIHLALASALVCLRFSVTSLLLLQLWMLNSDSLVASVPETCSKAERSPAAATPCGPSLSAARALKLLYTACAHPGPQQRE